MPAIAVRAATAATTSRHALKPTSLISPAVVAALAAHRYKGVIVDGCTKILACKPSSSNSSTVGFESNSPFLPRLSLSRTSQGYNQPLHASSSKEKKFSHLSAASTSLFGDQNNVLHGIPRLPTRRRSPELPRAYKSDFFRLPFPVLAEKPEWWWRTLACLPYLISLYMSDTGNFIQPFLEHYDYFGLVYFVPGAVSRLPAYFPMVYYYIALLGVVKNKQVPHFFRFHLMMGMLLETALQVVWYTSNFFPLIHFNGTYGMYYWAGVGFAYILILLQCVRCALAGGYAQMPLISDAALVHTMFNIGGFQRPF
ncbi:protein TIC 20-IV, chloroplastic [Ricinus communis]|uniref:Protein TIC 20 n=1 Tax=Ricinus communis TaxID=3988 RepID=B9RW66_RICCO|nr:protein TIC 20-IV, chloroplastic [Ricinus communis]EEF44503.1 conserved hypothetical protein [Ricinus communis]|eukprot:XP_002517985.1 protein TIC 20-IV, chloroplastic [Ricinus communis]